MGMRISVDKSDSGYETLSELAKDGWFLSVTLDGVFIPAVVTADEELGELIAQKMSVDGKPITVDGSIVLTKLKGVVKINGHIPNDTRVLN